MLLVEDNLVNQKIVGKGLQRAGCVVYVANHGVEALQILRETDVWYETVKTPKHLDIILMDWQMPVMDGLTCSREIRRLQAENQIRRHVQIIATTANARDEQVETAIESGIVSIFRGLETMFLANATGLRGFETFHGSRFTAEDQGAIKHYLNRSNKLNTKSDK